jgi:hypothetical protein
MRTFVPFYASCAVALLTGAGCDSATTPLPTGPGAPSIPAPLIPQGEITVQSVQPETGATLTAEECDGGWCVSDFKLAVDVRADQDVAEPWVSVVQRRSTTMCGLGIPGRLPDASTSSCQHCDQIHHGLSGFVEPDRHALPVAGHDDDDGRAVVGRTWPGRGINAGVRTSLYLCPSVTADALAGHTPCESRRPVVG